MSILNLGSLNLDRTYRVPHFVTPGETILAQGYSASCGGKGLNQSIALARSGERVFHAGAVGPDGAPLRRVLEDSGVDLRYLQELDMPSGHAVIQLTPRGENCIIVCGGANAAVGTDFIDAALAHFGPGDILLLQNEISNVDHAIRAARARGVLVALNPSPITDGLPGYPLDCVDLFILNEVEGRALGCGGDYPEILSALHRRFPDAAIVLTVGQEGAYYRDASQTLHQESYPVPVVDTTAAGDTFCGYFIACISRGLSPAQALDIASRASSLTVSRLGAADSIPYWKEVVIL